MAPRAVTTVDAYLEVGTRRVFACALDLPGWCRGAKTEEDALAALVAYAPRYAEVAAIAGVEIRQPPQPRVVERVPGNVTTDFGAPDVVPRADLRPLTAARAARHAALVMAAWDVFDRVAAAAPPVLRKGPRGGGRDRDAVIDHVLGAEASYARQLRIRQPAPARDDRAAVAQLRSAIAAAVRAARAPEAPTPKGWPPRYAARRIAWHVLDHAWEIEDRSS